MYSAFLPTSALLARRKTKHQSKQERRRRLQLEFLEDRRLLASDFGDAPAPYPTSLADHGARHTDTGPTLGFARDSETDGTPSAAADGDGADEDGVVFGVLRPGKQDAYVIVTVNDAPDGALLNGWIDFNMDGNWGGNEERVFANQVVADGDNVLTFDVPSWTPSESLFARFRLSTNSLETVTGESTDGEVEDYQVQVDSPVASTHDFSDPQSIFTDSFAITRTLDIDSDGDLDFFGSKTVSYWAEQNDDGTFTRHDLGHELIEAVDVDFDGDIDFLALNSNGSDLLWLYNDGNQQFNAQALGVTLSGKTYVNYDGNGEGRVADIDMDGDYDLAITVEAGTDELHVLEQTDSGWQRHVVTTNGGATLYDGHIADMDRDGDMDITFSTYDGPSQGRVGWFRNDGNWNFTELTFTTSWGQATGAFPVDYDADGYMDVLATGASDLGDEIQIYRNNQNGTFTGLIPQSDITPHTEGVNSVAIADLSGDGDFDIVWGDWWGRSV
ncbi:MAG: FG-GAP-like repeat-containing protein, partial [Pirellulales bacterium]